MIACCKCGATPQTDPDEKFVRDVTDGAIFCDWCAREIREICWNVPHREPLTRNERKR